MKAAAFLRTIVLELAAEKRPSMKGEAGLMVILVINFHHRSNGREHLPALRAAADIFFQHLNISVNRAPRYIQFKRQIVDIVDTKTAGCKQFK